MKEKIDVKKLINQLTLEMYEILFKEMGIPIYSKAKDKWVLYTACHNKNPLSGSPKLYFYLDTKVFVCYTGCNSSFNIVSLTMKRLALMGEDGGFLNAVNFILSKTGLDKSAISRINPKKNTYDWEKDFSKFIRFKNGVSELPIYDKSILDQLDKAIPAQWLDEGISPETLIKYQIGYYPRISATTIPMFGNEGELHGIRVREWNPEIIESYGKYHPLALLDGTVYKFPTNAILYGLNYNWPNIEQTGQVWICEGEKGVMKLDTFYGDKSCAVAMLGNNLGINRRNTLIKYGVKDVVLVVDCDFIGKDDEEFEKWKKHILKQAELWKGYAKVSVVFDDGEVLGPKENATDKDFETWLKLYEERETIG